MKPLLLAFCICLSIGVRAQDTFSIVALDPATGEVGSAGASCVNLIPLGLPAGFLGELIPGVGAINTQASYLAANQNNARARMQAGDTPAQIISWLVANDVQNNAAIRQYGIVAFVNNVPQSAAHTGTSTQNYKGHRTGPTYSIQGNILLGPQILDSMEYRFNTTTGSLATKLMAALQGANVVGADTRCTGNGTSSLFAFLKVSKPTDSFGNPYLNLGVMTASNAQLEPIDSLQIVYNNWLQTTAAPTPIGPGKITLWPNPAHTELHLTSVGTELKKADLFTMQGKKINCPATVGESVRIDIQGLASGMYLLTVSDEENRQTQLKFIKE